jgi:hypothetical protein
MIRLAAFSVLLVGFVFQSSLADAAETAPLFQLAGQYRTAVQDFERAVLRVRGIDRNDERLVDRLDDETARMRLAARNPRHLNRLFHEWQGVQKLHAQVQSRIFSKYTPHHELIRKWETVSYYYNLFAEEYFYSVENPRHGNSVRRFQSSSARRNSYLRPPTP